MPLSGALSASVAVQLKRAPCDSVLRHADYSERRTSDPSRDSGSRPSRVHCSDRSARVSVQRRRRKRAMAHSSSSPRSRQRLGTPLALGRRKRGVGFAWRDPARGSPASPVPYGASPPSEHRGVKAHTAEEHGPAQHTPWRRSRARAAPTAHERNEISSLKPGRRCASIGMRYAYARAHSTTTLGQLHGRASTQTQRATTTRHSGYAKGCAPQ